MRKIVDGILLGAAAAVVAFSVWVFSPFADDDLVYIVGSSEQFLLALLAVGAGFYITAKSSFPLSLRRAWGLMTLGILVGSMGEMSAVYFVLAVGIIPFPSLADIFYLLAYPLALAGILSFPYAATRPEQRLLFITDNIIVVLVCAAFLWYFVAAQLFEAGMSGLPSLITIAYPTGDLMILIGILSLIQRDVQGIRRKILKTLTSSMILFFLGDIMYALLSASEVDFTNILWQVDGLMFMVARTGFLAATFWQATETHFEMDQAESFSPLLRTNLVYLAVLSGMGLAFAALTSLLDTNLRLYGTIFGTFGITLAVLLRQYFVLRDNRRLNQEVEQMAVTDALTGISNRRFFDRVLARVISHAQRYCRPFSLLLMDVNKFKQYNDQYGHVQGDWLLRELAQLLKQNLRASDLIARYGGDEFVAILPETDLEASRLVVEKLHTAVAASALGISISIGCAAFQSHMTADNLLEQADQEMYRQKTHRREG